MKSSFIDYFFQLFQSSALKDVHWYTTEESITELERNWGVAMTIFITTIHVITRIWQDIRSSCQLERIHYTKYIRILFEYSNTLLRWKQKRRRIQNALPSFPSPSFPIYLPFSLFLFPSFSRPRIQYRISHTKTSTWNELISTLFLSL